MSPRSEHDKKVDKILDMKVANELERQKVTAPTAGGHGMPRPPEEMFRQAYGDAQSFTQMREGAHKEAWQRDLFNERAKEMLPELQAKMEGRQQPQEGREPARSQERKLSSARDRLKNKITEMGVGVSGKKKGDDGIER